MITNTNSVGVVRDAVIGYAARRWPAPGTATQDRVVAARGGRDVGRRASTTSTGCTSRPSTRSRRSTARPPGPVAEGNVGGGTGMVCYEFKGGIGTASRVLDGEGRRLHGGRAGAGQLRPAPPAPHRGPARWARELREGLVEHGGHRLHHHRGGDRRAAAAAPAQAAGPPRRARPGPHRQRGRQRLGRPLHRVLDRQPDGAGDAEGVGRCECCPTTAWGRCSRPRWAPRRRPSSTRWWRPAP